MVIVSHRLPSIRGQFQLVCLYPSHVDRNYQGHDCIECMQFLGSFSILATFVLIFKCFLGLKSEGMPVLGSFRKACIFGLRIRAHPIFWLILEIMQLLGSFPSALYILFCALVPPFACIASIVMLTFHYENFNESNFKGHI